jgi:hypothetical protein
MHGYIIQLGMCHTAYSFNTPNHNERELYRIRAVSSYDSRICQFLLIFGLFRQLPPQQRPFSELPVL